MNRESFLVCSVVFVLVAMVSCSLAQQEPSSPPEIRYGEAQEIGRLANDEIIESSGLAVSRRRADVFWTHNDSGDEPRLFALDAAGHDLGTVRVAGAKNVDWEDIASFDWNGQSTLVVADVGDNGRERAECVLYFVADPPAGVTEAKLLRTIRFKYADGPRDCEAMAIDPAGPTVLFLSKVFLPPAQLHRLDIPRQPTNDLLVAKPLAAVDIVLATGMDISPDGQRAIVINYAEGFEFTRRTGEDWHAAFSRRPRRIALPVRRQGEAVCYGSDGKSLYLTSEGQRSLLWNIPAK